MKIALYKKGLLSRVVEMTSKQWEYYFAGITFGQYGFGFVWRKRKIQ